MDNGDRTVLVNPNLGGITFGWNLQHTAQDELFAAIEGTAFHTRMILDRMSEYGAAIRRVINGGGIPQNNPVLNQVYANVLGRPVLVPSSKVTVLVRLFLHFLRQELFAASKSARIRYAPHIPSFTPQPEERETYDELYALFRRMYFDFGKPSPDSRFGDVLPKLIQMARVSRVSRIVGGYDVG